MKKFLFVLVVMGLVLSSGPVWAKDGFYIGGDLGIAVAPSMDLIGSDDDVGTPSDGFVNSGNYLMQPRILPDPLRTFIMMILAERLGFWQEWLWAIVWAASGSKENISIAARPLMR